MWTWGIEVAKYRHGATLLDEAGRPVFTNLSVDHSREGVEAWRQRLTACGQAPAGVRIGMEATGHYGMILFEMLSQAGYQPELINPLVTAARRNVTIRGSKTDSTDAMLIARLRRETDLKVGAVPQGQPRQLRDLTRRRFDCAHQAVGEKRRWLGLLDLAFPEYHQPFAEVTGVTRRAVLEAFPTAQELAQVDLRRLTRLLRQASRGRFGPPPGATPQSRGQKLLCPHPQPRNAGPGDPLRRRTHQPAARTDRLSRPAPPHAADRSAAAAPVPSRSG